VSLPLFVAAMALTFMDFAVIWRYFAWSNQTLAAIVLWVVTYYLISERKLFWVSLVPAVFMTTVSVSYILVAPEGLGLQPALGYSVAFGVALVLLVITLLKAYRKQEQELATIS